MPTFGPLARCERSSSAARPATLFARPDRRRPHTARSASSGDQRPRLGVLLLGRSAVRPRRDRIVDNSPTSAAAASHITYIRESVRNLCTSRRLSQSRVQNVRLRAGATSAERQFWHDQWCYSTETTTTVELDAVSIW